MAATLNANPIIYQTSTSSALSHRREQQKAGSTHGGWEEADSSEEVEGLDAAQLPFLSSVVLVSPAALSGPAPLQHSASSLSPLSSFDSAVFFPISTSSFHSSSSASSSSSSSSTTVSSPSVPCSSPSSAVGGRDAWDALEVFELVRGIVDPEHPLTLEQLHVTQLHLISVDDDGSRIDVRFTPTINHCSMATLIGLCLRVQLLRCLPQRFKVDIRITEGSHATEAAINKQLNDKERVAAALENSHLLDVVNKCITLPTAAQHTHIQ